MIKRAIPATICLTLILSPAFWAGQQKQLDVPYVPTKYAVVDEMLKMADIQKADLVYDLGCGDGRLVIGAAQKFGAHGKGFDIDPERIQESRDNAQKAGVTNLVSFFEQDLFTTDFHEASVMTLYLLTSVNLKLRPKMLRELRPGTRIVSHNFGMGEWKPDQSSTVMVDDISHEVYLWIIPANLSGTWTWTMGKPEIKGEMTVQQLFQQVMPAFKIGGKAATARDLSLKGDRLKFVLDLTVGGKTVPATFEAVVGSQTLAGTVKLQDGGKDVVWEWKAKRSPATEKPVDADADRYDSKFGMKPPAKVIY
jgi:ubiquinone/menaquinone biosynthesis C-methylase UbiE